LRENDAASESGLSTTRGRRRLTRGPVRSAGQDDRSAPTDGPGLSVTERKERRARTRLGSLASWAEEEEKKSGPWGEEQQAAAAGH
jgi:hypothetical protein